MAKTSIEWCQNPDGTPGEVWNPVTGCTKVSQGCKFCFAERIANRFWGERKFTDVVCHEDRLEIPFSWKKPRRVFVNSMSDLFHPDVPVDFIGRVVDVMGSCPQHAFMILTKRPQRMMELWRINSAPGGVLSPILSNVWLGVSVENQQAADERIPLLLQTPAAVRFVSCEPLLGPVDLTKINVGNGDLGDCLGHKIDRIWTDPPRVENWGKVDWVICGGESGAGCRPMDIEWARNMLAQCRTAGVPYFFKQLGGHPNKRHDPAEWPEDLRVQCFPED